MMRLDGVSVRLGRGSNATQVLDGLDLEIERGATVALVGPSGCGKSTVLRTVLGLIEPDAGTVEVDGTSVDRNSRGEIRRRVGFVIQDGGLFPHLTAARNATLPAVRERWASDRITARLAELARLVEIESDLLGAVAVRVLDLTTQHRGELSQAGRFVLHVTDDDQRLIVRAVVRSNLGPIQADLIEAAPTRLGTPGPAGLSPPDPPGRPRTPDHRRP